MWGMRVVVPYNLQEKILKSLHETHAGIVRMKSLARQFVWWPDMNKRIKDMVKSCPSCCINRSDPPSAPLHPWQFPERSWQRLHIDLAGPIQNKMFLIIMDAHTKWPEVYDMQADTTSKKVIEKLRDCFVRFGIPEQLVSDNGRQFVSVEFRRFCRNNGIRHTTSSAYHSRTNGEAERFVQTLKKAIHSSEGDLTFRIQRFLFSYRCTQHATTGVSPAELLIGRRPRNIFDLIKPNVPRTVSTAQTRQEENYNTRVRNRQFEEEEDVWVRTFSKNEAKWSLGTIIKALGPVTYLIRVGDQSYKRHVDQIHNAMPIRCSQEEENNLQDNENLSGRLVKREPKSTSPEKNEEPGDIDTADEIPGISEMKQPASGHTTVPAATTPRQRSQRTRKQPDQLEYS